MSDESKGMFLGLVGVVSFGLTLPATRFIIPYFSADELSVIAKQ